MDGRMKFGFIFFERRSFFCGFTGFTISVLFILKNPNNTNTKMTFANTSLHKMFFIEDIGLFT